SKIHTFLLFYLLLLLPFNAYCKIEINVDNNYENLKVKLKNLNLKDYKSIEKGANYFIQFAKNEKDIQCKINCYFLFEDFLFDVYDNYEIPQNVLKKYLNNLYKDDYSDIDLSELNGFLSDSYLYYESNPCSGLYSNINFNSILTAFGDFMNLEWRMYIGLLSLGGNKIYVGDGGTGLSSIELADLLIGWESLRSTSQNLNIRLRAGINYRSLFRSIILGFENMPIVDYENDKLVSEYYLDV